MALSSIEDRYLSALTAAQFPDMPADEPVMPVDAAGMDSPNLDGMQLAAGPSRTMSDAGGGMGEMKAYDPTTRERLASFLQSGFEGLGMDRVKARQRAQTLIGGPSSNLPLSLGLADIMPIIGTTMQLEESGRTAEEAMTSAKRGDYGTAALQAGAAAAGLIPGAASTVKASKPVIQIIGRSLTPKGAKLTPNIEVPAAGDITKPAFKKWFGDSKVTNDAGQPIVVYHARAGDFDSFDTAGRGKTKGTGAFFSSSADVASTYGVKGDENIVPAYLSMKRPVVIDANGSNWSDIDMGAKISVPEIKVSDIEEQQLLAELTGSAVDESAMKTIPAAEMSLGELKINNKLIDRKVNTDDIARWARKMGYDGLIIKNVIDSGPSGRYMPDEAMNPHNVYVAFEPTQIKSVFNKGTWNPDDPRMVQGAGAATAGTGAATMSDKEQK
jgi:hypothetical protein